MRNTTKKPVKTVSVRKIRNRISELKLVADQSSGIMKYAALDRAKELEDLIK